MSESNDHDAKNVKKKEMLLNRLLNFVIVDMPGQKRQPRPPRPEKKPRKSSDPKPASPKKSSTKKKYSTKKTSKKKQVKKKRERVEHDNDDIIESIVGQIVDNVHPHEREHVIEEIIEQVVEQIDPQLEPVEQIDPQLEPDKPFFEPRSQLKKQKTDVQTVAFKDEEDERIELWKAMIEEERITNYKAWKDERRKTTSNYKAWKDEETETKYKDHLVYPENEEGQMIYYPQTHDEFIHNGHLHTFGYKINNKLAEITSFTKARIVRPPIEFLDVPDYINVEVEWPRDDPVPANPNNIPDWANSVLFVGNRHYFYFTNVGGVGKLQWIANRYPYVDDSNVEHDYYSSSNRHDERDIYKIPYDGIYSHRIVKDIFTDQAILDGMFYQDEKSIIWTLFAEASNFWIELPKPGEHMRFFAASQLNQQIPQLVKNRIAKLSKNKKLVQDLEKGSLSITTDVEPLNSIKPLPFMKNGKLMFIYKEDNTDTVSEQSSDDE